jgi:hypothetical protein
VTPITNTATISNIVPNSRLRIFNVTTDTETFNGIVTGNNYTENYTEGSNYTNGDSLQIRLTYQSGVTAQLGFQQNVSVGSIGWSTIVEQEDDLVYITYGIDGSTITKFEIDIPNLDFDLNIVANFSGAELYAWYSNMLTTEDGIRSFFNAITPIDAANVRLDNQTSSNVFQNDNIRIFRADGTYPVINPTSGGGGIDINWRNVVFTIETGTSGLTTSESLLLSSIKPDLTIINNGVKRTSLLIPYNDDLT